MQSQTSTIDPLDVTVAICTYDRCVQLEATLGALARLRVPPALRWELIVVNNRCTDATDDVIARWKDRLPIRRLYHAKPGLGGARNAALAEARGAVIAWTDDDCIVDAEWLTRIWTEFRADPDLAGFGGRVELYNPRDLPLTLQTRRARAELARNHRITRQDLFMIPGCNMAFSRSTFEAVGNFDERLGAGTRSGSAEDTDFLYRVLRSGCKIRYFPDAVVYHNHGRRTEEQALRLRRNYALGRGAFYCKHLLAFDRAAYRLWVEELSAPVSAMFRAVFLQTKWLFHIGLGVLYRVARR